MGKEDSTVLFENGDWRKLKLPFLPQLALIIQQTEWRSDLLNIF